MGSRQSEKCVVVKVEVGDIVRIKLCCCGCNVDTKTATCMAVSANSTLESPKARHSKRLDTYLSTQPKQSQLDPSCELVRLIDSTERGSCDCVLDLLDDRLGFVR